MAVVPLEPGSGASQYQGLGRALAGMLMSDLDQVPSLELVERSRLDALLAEIELGESGYVDPTTAARLGRGLGAEAMVLGSWAVVEGTFAMDARLVQVKTGDVVRAAAAQGPLADFVAVEKEVVEGLLDELEVELSSGDRRRLLVQAPTESFDALKAWGEGLEAEAVGDLDRAVAAYERAVRSDPRFAAAQALLENAKARVGARRDEARTEQESQLATAMDAVLAAVPDERERRSSFHHDTRTAAEFLVRMGVLELQGRHCQRYEELWAYAERRDWQMEQPPRSPDYEGVTGYLTGKVAEQYGLRGIEASMAAREIQKGGLVANGGMIGDITSFVLDNRVHNLRELGHGLVSSLHQCFAPAGRLEQLDRLRTRLDKAGVLGHVRNKNHSRFDLGMLLSLEWLHANARLFGADEEFSRRVDAVLASSSPDDPVSEERLMDRVDSILQEAERTETARRQQLGLSAAAFAEELRRALRGEGLPQERAGRCAALVKHGQLSVDNWLERADTAFAKFSHPQDAERELRGRALAAGAVLATWRQQGCAPGAQVEISTKAEALAVVDRALAGAVQEERCGSSTSSLRSVSQAWRDSDYPLPEDQLDTVVFSMLLSVHTGLGQGCFALR